MYTGKRCRGGAAHSAAQLTEIITGPPDHEHGFAATGLVDWPTRLWSCGMETAHSSLPMTIGEVIRRRRSSLGFDRWGMGSA